MKSSQHGMRKLFLLAFFSFKVLIDFFPFPKPALFFSPGQNCTWNGKTGFPSAVFFFPFLVPFFLLERFIYELSPGK